MSRYKIVESVQEKRLHDIHRYEDLGIHHPTANDVGIRAHRLDELEPRRIHRVVEGRFEEVRPLSDGRVLVKKDFVLSHDGHGPVRIPAPADGYVHYLHDKTATMRIYDRPFGQQGAKLLTQVLHMEQGSFYLREGERVAYGQPLGTMGDTGTPRVFHAHVEGEPALLRRYIHDINAGVITPDSYPALSETQPSQKAEIPKPASTHEAIQAAHEVTHPHSEPDLQKAMRSGDTGTRIAELQQGLSTLGYRDADGHPLTADGSFGPNTKFAVESFQRAHGLHVDGVVGKRTSEAMADAGRWPLLSEATHPEHRLYSQILQGIHKLPGATPRSERELENAAVALTIAARAVGFRQVDHVVLGTDGINLFAVQGRMDDPAHRRTRVELAHAVEHTVDHRSAALHSAPEPLRAAPAPHVVAQSAPVTIAF
jgi:type IV secretion system effector X-Tfes-like protein/putative peptidoglycan binding protein